MSMLALFAPPSLSSRLDIVKVTKMCLFHDKFSHFISNGIEPIRRNYPLL